MSSIADKGAAGGDEEAGDSAAGAAASADGGEDFGAERFLRLTEGMEYS